MQSDLYSILNISSAADTTEICKAYRRAALLAHPDKGGTSASFHSVSYAFQVLSCPVARQHYDRSRGPEPADSAVPRRRPPPSQRGAKRRADAHFSARPSKYRRRVDEGLESVRAILHDMPAPQRRQALLSTTPSTRQALLEFMQQFSKTATDAARSEQRQPTRAASYDTEGLLGHVHSSKTKGGSSHQARVYVNSLCLYTRRQARLENAIEHQIVLLEIRRSLLAAASADAQFWEDPSLMRRACDAALMACGVSETEIGLRACVMLRAVRWIGPRHRIVTTSSSLADALDTHVGLITARATSWEAFRTEWLRHLARSATYGQTGDQKCPRVRTRLSAEKAKDFVDAAREKALDGQLSKSIRRVEQLLKLAEKAKAKKARTNTCKARGGG